MENKVPDKSLEGGGVWDVCGRPSEILLCGGKAKSVLGYQNTKILFYDIFVACGGNERCV